MRVVDMGYGWVRDVVIYVGKGNSKVEITVHLFHEKACITQESLYYTITNLSMKH